MIEIKGENGEIVLFEIINTLYKDAQDDIDADFLRAFVKARVNGFTADFAFVTCKAEMLNFLNQLKQVNTFKISKLIFNTIEDNLIINISITELGNLLWKFQLKFPNENNAVLIIHLQNDISYLPNIINDLTENLHFLEII